MAMARQNLPESPLSLWATCVPVSVTMGR